MTRSVALPLTLLALLASSALAQEAPDALVKRVAEDVLATIRADKDIQAGNQARSQHEKADVDRQPEGEASATQLRQHLAPRRLAQPNDADAQRADTPADQRVIPHDSDQ